MSAQAPTQIDSQRTSCTNSTHYQPNDLLAGAARSGQSQTGSLSHAQDSPLQIQDAAASRRPVESSVWNWDTPLDTIGESASYYYEPQGELLQEHRELGPSSTDFSIPHAIGGVDGTWKLANCETACDSTQAHTVPTRPSSAVPPTAGVKRKLAVEQEPSEGNSDPKRTSCVMSDGGDGETPSPMDPRPPARLTRSQSTQNPRGPSITDAAENRPRQSGAESRRARAGPSSTTSSRRPATEPPAPLVLPARKVFPIQIGDKLFRLSGASISSDGQWRLLIPSQIKQLLTAQSTLVLLAILRRAASAKRELRQRPDTIHRSGSRDLRRHLIASTRLPHRAKRRPAFRQAIRRRPVLQPATLDRSTIRFAHIRPHRRCRVPDTTRPLQQPR